MSARRVNHLANLTACLARPTEVPVWPWFTIRDVAILTGRTPEQVRTWRARGLPAKTNGTRRLYVARADLVAWLAANPWAHHRRDQHYRRLAALCAPKPWPTDLRAQTRLLRRARREHQRWAALAEKALRELGVTP